MLNSIDLNEKLVLMFSFNIGIFKNLYRFLWKDHDQLKNVFV